MSTKPKVEPEAPALYRSRATKPGPFGNAEPPTEGDLADILPRARADRALGMAPVIERKVPGAGWLKHHPVVTLAELSTLGLARESVETAVSSNGRKSSRSSWKIEPAGLDIIAAAATADPIDFDLDSYREEPPA